MALSGGRFGSSSVEDRSEMRDTQRCAEFRELQEIERMALRTPGARHIRVGVYQSSSLHRVLRWWSYVGYVRIRNGSRLNIRVGRESIPMGVRLARLSSIAHQCTKSFICLQQRTRPRLRLPAEFKHISERRNRN